MPRLFGKRLLCVARLQTTVLITLSYPNVYGIDMPTRHELVAHNRTEDEVAEEIGADCVIYQVWWRCCAYGLDDIFPSDRHRCIGPQGSGPVGCKIQSFHNAI